MSKSRSRILFIVDHPNWAHDFKTQNLTRVLADSYDIQKRYQTEVTSADLHSADLIVVYYWIQFEAMKHLASLFDRYSEKVLVGVCSNWELEAERREPGQATLNRFAHAVFVNNLFLYRELQTVLGRPIFYTPNGVDTNFFRPALQKQSFSTLRVGWAGSLTNHGPGYKRYHELIVPAVNSLDGAELITAASEPGQGRPNEMRSFYQSLDVYVCASQTEGTPNPCLEAAACGVPLVTTRVGNMPELVRDRINSFFIEDTQEDLTDKLRILRDSPALRLSFGEELLKNIQSWDWSIKAQPYQQMFDEILAGKSFAAELSRALGTDLKTAPVEQEPSEWTGRPDLSQIREELIQLAKSNLDLLPESFFGRHQSVEVTIVLLSYGRLERTLNAIRAVKENISIPFKLLLLDNNSGDEVRTQLAATCSDDDSIELILLDENVGCAGGRALAFNRVTTSYVLLIDNDLEILPGSLEHLLHQIELHPEAAAVTGKVVYPDGTVQLCGANFRVDQGIQFGELLGSGRRFDEDISVTGECDWVPGCMTLIRTDTLRRFPYDLSMRYYFEDNEWCHRINQAGAGKFYPVVEALGIHYHERKRPPSSQPVEESRKQILKYVETLAYFYEKYRLIYGGLFYFVPELGPPTDPLSISSARILLELVNARGRNWVLDRWNQNQLRLLFAPQSLSVMVEEKQEIINQLSAQIAQKEKTIYDLSHQLVEKDQTIQALADEEEIINQLSAQIAQKEEAIYDLSHQLVEKDQTIQALADKAATHERSLRSFSDQLATKESELTSITSTLGWRLLQRYGKIKYRYFLPAYRLLRLMPAPPKKREPLISNNATPMYSDEV